MQQQVHEGNGLLSRFSSQAGVQTVGQATSLLNIYGHNRLGGFDRKFTSEVIKNAFDAPPNINHQPRLNIETFKSSGNAFADIFNRDISKYDPKSNTATFAKNNYGIAAHELGHAEQYNQSRKHYKLRNVFKASRGLTSMNPAGLLAMLSPNESTASFAANLNLATSLPMLYEEVDAGRRGARILSNTSSFSKLGRLSKLGALARPFAGLPSYLIMALLPYLQVQASKKAGDYKGTY